MPFYLNGYVVNKLFFNGPQFARLLGLKSDGGLFKNPGFNLGMPHSQEVQGPDAVMLFRRGARLVAHDLSNDARRHFDPFSQGAKGAPKVMGRKIR